MAALGDVEMPTFPALMGEILRELRDTHSAMSKVGELVAQDPTLTIKVIKTVNSVGFGLRRQVDSVKHAVTLLGRSRVESIVLPLAVGEALPSESVPGFEPARFWHAAARRALVAQQLSALLDPASRDVSYTASLLQDMAIPLLATHRSESYGPILERWHDGGGVLHEMEKAAFGWTHADVAGWLCADWGFPELLAAAITAHHGSDDPEVVSPPPVRLVALLGEEPDGELNIDPLVAMAHDEFGASPERVIEAVQRGVAGSSEVSRLFAA